ncbi:MAG: potassium uptake protein, Kup system [Gammaproteobacteria bacterium]|nr:potassium uptake protein, Kup system [Gammaproteobacteria bacterium]
MNNTPVMQKQSALALAALGIVFGDIGTSPLYAVRQCFFGVFSITPVPANIFGVMSLIFWSLILIVTIKYAIFMLRADNHGEGGILALMTLLIKHKNIPAGAPGYLLTLGLVGAAFLYADAMITPAITVLSAVEGLNVFSSRFASYVVPSAVMILILLFWCQHFGTGRIGVIFGPVMLVWFSVIAILGALSVVQTPEILLAVNPMHAIRFFSMEGFKAFAILGIVFLVITGAEALYADLGHFGRNPIRLAWFVVILPSLLINYFGQSALLLRSPATADNLFYQLAPTWAVIPLIAIATLAAVIASQAVIAGAFSSTSQAIHLGLLPRMNVRQMSAQLYGQIFIPVINNLFLIMTVLLVIIFQSSGALAGAYGIAVASTMVITTFLFYFILRDYWHWHPVTAGLFVIVFLCIDGINWGSTLLRISAGGWIPLAVAFIVASIMLIWHRGRRQLELSIDNFTMNIDVFLESLRINPPIRVPGTGVFLTAREDMVPRALLHNLKHNKVMHEYVLIVTAASHRVPYVHKYDDLPIIELRHNIYQITLHFGFLEKRDIPAALNRAFADHPDINPDSASYFLTREDLMLSGSSSWKAPRWVKLFFIFLWKIASDPAKYFNLPTGQVVEIGAPIKI